MSEKDRKKTAQLNIRLKPALRDALALCATHEVRSVTQQVEYFIIDGLQRYSERNPKFTPHWEQIYGDPQQSDSSE